jgi:hypothetical protein
LAIKIARAHDLGPQQAVLTVATDGAKAGAGRMAHETSSSANPTPEIAEPFNLLRRPRI